MQPLRYLQTMLNGCRQSAVYINDGQRFTEPDPVCESFAQRAGRRNEMVPGCHNRNIVPRLGEHTQQAVDLSYIDKAGIWQMLKPWKSCDRRNAQGLGRGADRNDRFGICTNSISSPPQDCCRETGAADMMRDVWHCQLA